MLFTAFIMGLIGSLHCVAMCGPLALAIPTVGTTRRSAIYSRLIYNSGRLVVYALLGVAFGVIGKSILLVGIQQSVSLGVGVAMLLFLLLGLCGVTSPF